MSELWSTIKTLGLGAGLMYLLDPDSGAKRRADLRRQMLEVAVMAGDEADQLLVTAGHKLAEQTCRLRSQVMHAVTGNGHHNAPTATNAPEEAAPTSQATAGPACEIANPRLLAGIGGSVLVAYGLRSRSPWAVAATALGLGLVIKAVLHEQSADSPHEASPDSSRPTAAQDADPESRWKVAQP